MNEEKEGFGAYFVILFLLIFLIIMVECAKGAVLENPATDSAIFQSETLLESGSTVYLTDLSGHVIGYAPTGRLDDTIVFDISTFRTGTYIFIVSNENGVHDSAVFTKL